MCRQRFVSKEISLPHSRLEQVGISPLDFETAASAARYSGSGLRLPTNAGG